MRARLTNLINSSFFARCEIVRYKVEPLLYKYTEGPDAPKAIEQVSNRVLSRIVDCVVKE